MRQAITWKKILITMEVKHTFDWPALQTSCLKAIQTKALWL